MCCKVCKARFQCDSGRHVDARFGRRAYLRRARRVGHALFWFALGVGERRACLGVRTPVRLAYVFDMPGCCGGPVYGYRSLLACGFGFWRLVFRAGLAISASVP